MFSVFLILVSSMLLFSHGSMMLGGGITILTSTMTTTVEVTYNYFTSSNGTTLLGGHLTTSTLAIPMTATSTFANSTSSAWGPLPTLGFDPGWIIVGLVLGIVALYLIRRHTHEAYIE
ncbi:MAG: hypothetical protein ABSF82_12735 [Candidatus Bathyarchaeia archaeon]|jgi:hypothetical protein